MCRIYLVLLIFLLIGCAHTCLTHRDPGVCGLTYTYTIPDLTGAPKSDLILNTYLSILDAANAIDTPHDTWPRTFHKLMLNVSRKVMEYLSKLSSH